MCLIFHERKLLGFFSKIMKFKKYMTIVYKYCFALFVCFFFGCASSTETIELLCFSILVTNIFVKVTNPFSNVIVFYFGVPILPFKLPLLHDWSLSYILLPEIP